ncbi:hypothetical protein SODALDRAFT_313002 [Sodiomyces alkalinus F11]|uniref:Increased loss of mitochondrial DNA protein 1 n=1 Tax=Sodiomyces alkalinus (strain CBS 110278 / VKM F-3762 / F11) TaxID=1314773 RepID=A0A3N2PRE8_SODAK|nr:hypothetical protein SODALDRAFT_313002 [Sodiomyces alkalinus F11]ROT37058.1 hypothetical protein SODALDRAFT_313002 [Sodiomyces alkalinus F11]
MALISATTIITSLALFHLTLAFFFLTSPATIADQALVWILGESMGMPTTRSFDTRSPGLAFLSVMFAFIGLGDLISLTMPEEISLLYHWGTQAPFRLFFSLCLVLYTVFFGPSSPLYRPDTSNYLSHPSAHVPNPGYAASGWGGDGLKNRVFFTFAFIEMISWFWVWVTLREERPEVVRRSLKGRRGSQGRSN